MKSRTSRRFRELFAKLPARVQIQVRQSYTLFSVNPRHPGLRFKQVRTNPPIWSARVGIGYRSVGAFDGDTIVWFWIGSHASYDQLLETM